MAAAERTTGVLVRVGADTSCGGVNSPVRIATGDFVYVPVPERPERVRSGFERPYSEVAPHVRALVGGDALDPWLPRGRAMHLDPDFEHLTYADFGARRETRVASLAAGDFIAFYASLRPVDRAGWLVYALIGFLTVERVVRASEVRERDWHRNAHTRRAQVSADDVVVFGAAGASGRLERAIPIGEYRGCAYRVRRDLLKTWGGLTTADGFLQRSAVPPLFRDPPAFLRWFQDQRPRLLEANWGGARHGGLEESGRVVTLPARRIASA